MELPYGFVGDPIPSLFILSFSHLLSFNSFEEYISVYSKFIRYIFLKLLREIKTDFWFHEWKCFQSHLYRHMSLKINYMKKLFVSLFVISIGISTIYICLHKISGNYNSRYSLHQYCKRKAWIIGGEKVMVREWIIELSKHECWSFDYIFVYTWAGVGAKYIILFWVCRKEDLKFFGTNKKFSIWIFKRINDMIMLNIWKTSWNSWVH